MTDIYAVNYIIEHVDYLRYDRRQRELEKQLSDRLSAEKRFIFFHLITPMHAKNEQSNYITAPPVVKGDRLIYKAPPKMLRLFFVFKARGVMLQKSCNGGAGSCIIN